MNNLLEIANNINSAFKKSQELYQTGINTLQQALLFDKEAGDLLVQVKSSLPHGQFTSWVEANCKFSIRHAQFLMKISREWDRIIKQWEELKNETRFAFESPLPSLRVAIALAAAEPKPPTPPSPAPPETYKVVNPQHSCYGQTVKFSQSLHNGDLLVCETASGQKAPFLKNELIAGDKPLPQAVDVEVIDVEIEDKSEQLREAIALILEYLPELPLKSLLAQALFIGREYLSEDAQLAAAKLINSQEIVALKEAS